MSQIHSFSYLKQHKLRKSVLELAQLSDLQLLPILFTFAALLNTISLFLVGLFPARRQHHIIAVPFFVINILSFITFQSCENEEWQLLLFDDN